MSMAEKAQQLVALGERAPAAQIQQLISEIEQWGAEAAELLGAGHSSAQVIGGMVAQAVQTCQQLLEGIQLLQQVAAEEAGKHLG